MSLLLSATALAVSVVTALGAAAVARRVLALELQSDNSIRVLRDGAPATISLSDEGAFLQAAERSLVLAACGSCVSCQQLVEQHLDQVDLPAAVARIVVQPDDDPVPGEQVRLLQDLGWSLQSVDRGSFLAVSAGAYPSMLLSQDHGRDLTYLGPVGTPALLENALEKVVERVPDRTGSPPRSEGPSR